MMEYEVVGIPSSVLQNPPEKNQPIRMRLLKKDLVFRIDGGIETHIEGMKYPMKGYPFYEIVERVADVKRIAISLVKFVSQSPLRYFIPILAILPNSIFNKIIFSFIKEFSNFSGRILRKYYLKPEVFCQSGREIYRAGKEMINSYPDEEKKNILTEFMTIICMIWEFDTAYRYPGQDVLGELNQKNARKSGLKEIMRLFDILIKREGDENLKIKFRAGRFILFWLMATKKNIRNIVGEFLLKIDINKIKMDVADLYHAYPKKGYNFQGKSYKQGMVERETL